MSLTHEERIQQRIQAIRDREAATQKRKVEARRVLYSAARMRAMTEQKEAALREVERHHRMAQLLPEQLMDQIGLAGRRYIFVDGTEVGFVRAMTLHQQNETVDVIGEANPYVVGVRRTVTLQGAHIIMIPQFQGRDWPDIELRDQQYSICLTGVRMREMQASVGPGSSIVAAHIDLDVINWETTA